MYTRLAKDTVFWDQELTGFGVRVYPTGGKVYIAQARGPGGPKRVTVGRHGVLGAEQARRRAALLIARVKAGEEPVPEPMAMKLSGGPTVGELARRYLEEYVAMRCKPSTMKSTRTVVNHHIVPALGKLPLEAVERSQVADLHQRLCKTPSVANMAVRTLPSCWVRTCPWSESRSGTRRLHELEAENGPLKRLLARRIWTTPLSRTGCQKTGEARGAPPVLRLSASACAAGEGRPCGERQADLQALS